MNIRRGNSEQAFSLVELLLTLVLILCLAAASVFSYTALHRTANLDEGLNRIESLIRFAQAEAATTGRKIRLQFELARPVQEESAHELREIRVTWEPDFLSAPGVFQQYTNKAWSEEMVNEIVGVAKVRAIQPDGSQQIQEMEAAIAPSIPAAESETETALESESESTESEFPSITFYPDGSCDSAEIILASKNEEDARLLEVRLSGILGSVSSRVVQKQPDQQVEDALAEEQEPGTTEVGADVENTPVYTEDPILAAE